MRQKLVPRTVRRPSPTPAVMVRLRSTNTKKIQFTQRLPLGSELHMGKERCCLRGLDHLHGPTFHSICGNLMIYKPSLTNDRLMFEHDESLRADLLLINFPASYENGKLEHFLHRWMKNREHNNFWLTMFPEKRYFQETTSTTEVAIHTNLFTDLYASIGTSSSRTGGWLGAGGRFSSGCFRSIRFLQLNMLRDIDPMVRIFNLEALLVHQANETCPRSFATFARSQVTSHDCRLSQAAECKLSSTVRHSSSCCSPGDAY
ncbi:hypothetical protein QYF36_004923 [Acer negundo]|nr:hypothetical protein Q3G72_030714 [Acer saccharum]KAK4837368.1 hypothetical protein QYF36_004923 [Acer negundo]